MSFVNQAYFADTFGLCWLCSDFNFTPHHTLCRGHDYPNSQHGTGYNSVASTLSGVIHTDCCRGMKHYCLICLNHCHIGYVIMPTSLRRDWSQLLSVSRPQIFLLCKIILASFVQTCYGVICILLKHASHHFLQVLTPEFLPQYCNIVWSIMSLLLFMFMLLY